MREEMWKCNSKVHFSLSIHGGSVAILTGDCGDTFETSTGIF